jgi:hypothetical protein
MEILIILTWLQIKHWIVDFVLQTDAQVKVKGIYGNPVGISHSLEHAIGTLVALLIASFYVGDLYVGWIIIAAVVDGVVHYHIDWAKMNWGNRDITTKAFWSHLGLDQMAHQICYLFLILILL